MRVASELPCPCPELRSVRNRIRRSEPLAACSAAAGTPRWRVKEIRTTVRYHVLVTAIDRSDAAAYLDRWVSMTQRERMELRETSTEQKLRQLSALFASRSLFPVNAAVEREREDLRERWHRIRLAVRERPIT